MLVKFSSSSEFVFVLASKLCHKWVTAVESFFSVHMWGLYYSNLSSLKGTRKKNWDFLSLAIWCPNPVEKTSPQVRILKCLFNVIQITFDHSVTTTPCILKNWAAVPNLCIVCVDLFLYKVLNSHFWKRLLRKLELKIFFSFCTKDISSPNTFLEKH